MIIVFIMFIHYNISFGIISGIITLYLNGPLLTKQIIVLWAAEPLEVKQ